MQQEINRQISKMKALDRWENEGGRIDLNQNREKQSKFCGPADERNSAISIRRSESK